MELFIVIVNGGEDLRESYLLKMTAAIWFYIVIYRGSDEI